MLSSPVHRQGKRNSASMNTGSNQGHKPVLCYTVISDLVGHFPSPTQSPLLPNTGTLALLTQHAPLSQTARTHLGR